MRTITKTLNKPYHFRIPNIFEFKSNIFRQGFVGNLAGFAEQLEVFGFPDRC